MMQINFGLQIWRSLEGSHQTPLNRIKFKEDPKKLVSISE